MSRNPKSKLVQVAIVIVAGLAMFAAGALAVNAATPTQIAKKKRGKAKPNFMIRANVPSELAPGRTVPIKLTLANNRLKALYITRLRVELAVDAAHAKRGCSAARDYLVVQMRKRTFPFRLPTYHRATKRKKARLRWRTLRPSRTEGRPQLIMRNLAGVNQDACKGATLTLRFISKSTTVKPKRKKAWRA